MENRLSGLFKNRFLRVILLSGLLLQIGIWVRNFAVLLFVMDKTKGDPVAVSMISVAEYAPIFIFSLIGGTFADRWPPKRTMIWCDFLSALSVFAVLIALILASWKVIFFATLFSAILSQFSQPSGMKLFKIHVPGEQMQMGMSIYQTLFAVFMILGPVLGTLVYQSLGIEVAIAVMGLAFLLSAGVLLFLPPDRQTEVTNSSSRLHQEIVSGLRYVWSKKVLKLLGACFTTIGLGLGLIQPLLIFIVTERLGLPKEYLQWFLIVNGSGMILGGILTLAISKKIQPPAMLALGMLGTVIGIAAISWASVLWLIFLIQFLIGLVNPSINISINTMIIQNTEDAFVGRVNGILNPLFIGSMVVTMSIAGGLKELLSLAAMYQISAILSFIGLLFFTPILRQPRKMDAGECSN